MTWKRVLGLAALLIAISLFASAQTDGTEPEGKSLGSYNVKQTIEFGGRINTGFGGNLSMYNSLVNLQSGPRLLDQSLSMRSENHTGVFFDTLTESASGFGGDPNQIGRFRMSKNKLYDFSFVYRHDQYYSDYNLLGNSIAVPYPNSYNVNIFNRSPHFMDTRRTMADFDLKLLPQNWVSFRVGYSRGKDVGPAYTSQHSPGDVLYLQNYSTRSDRYRVGADLNPFARTQLSYDFFYEHDRNDTAGVQDVNAIYFLGSASGIPIDPGFSFDPNATSASAPYGIPNCTFTAGSTPGQVVANSTCAGFISYNRTQPVKTDLPTHQLQFVSNYFRKLDLAASVSYTSGTSKIANYSELYSRFSSPTYSQNGIFGSLANRQVTGNADFRATVHLNSTWSVDEKFRWVNWRTPGFGSLTNTLTTNLTASTILTPAALPIPTTMTQYVNFFGENSKYNTVQLNWNPSRKIGAWIGYKLGLRDISDNSQTNTLTISTGVLGYGVAAPGSESETEHHALIGIVAHPVQQWRISADSDLMSSNGAYTLISPRHAQTIHVKSAYELGQRATISGSMGFNERRNDGYGLWPAVALANGQQYKAHNRSYGLDLDMHATRKLDVNFGWSYDDIYENSPQCIPINTGSASNGFGTNYCLYSTGVARSGSGGTYPMFSLYQETTNTGYIMVAVRPVNRVTLNLGYDITDNGGRQTWIRGDNGAVFQLPVDSFGNAVVNTTQTAVGTVAGLYPWLPNGTLSYAWHRPVVGLSVDMGKGLTFKGGFNNYDYHEKGVQPMPVIGRDFHGNTVTLSMKQSF